MGNEGIAVLLGLLVLAVLGGSFCGIVAVVKIATLEQALASLRRRIDDMGSASAETSEAPERPSEREKPEQRPSPAEKEEAEKEGPEEPEPPADAPAAGEDARPAIAKRSTEGLREMLQNLQAKRVAAPRPTGQEWLKKLEANVGKQWIAWAGALALFVAAGLFVKLAIDKNWIGVTGRVVIGIISGLALIAAGDRFIRRSFRALGLGLVGAGLAILYVSLFYSCERVMPQEAAFALMVLVTAAGMVLAVLHDGIALAFIAVLGGFLTPVLVSTGKDARDTLFAYLLLLDLGVIGVAFFKKWRALDVLAFVGTWALFAGWYAKFHDAATFSLVPTLLWLGAFYVVFLALPFAYHLRHQTRVPIEKFIAALVNAVVAFGYAYHLLREDYTHVLGFVSLGMAGSYVALGTLVRKRIASDARALLGLAALAVVFLTLTVPLHLKMHGITLAWAIEAPVLLYLGYRFRYFPVRALGMAVLACAAGHLFWAHWPLHDMIFTPVFNVNFASAMTVPLAGAVYAAVHHWKREGSAPHDRTLKVGCAVASAFLALVIAHAEIALWFEHSYIGRLEDYGRRSSTAFVWALGAAAFLAAGVRGRCLASRRSGLVAVLIAAALTTAAFGESLGTDHSLYLNARFVVGVAVVLVVFAYCYAIRRWRERCTEGEQGLVVFLGWTGIVLLWLLLSAEAYGCCLDTISPRREALWIAQMALSMVWSAYAVCLLAVGFWRGIRALRFVALALFGLTALKLVLVDMASVKQIYRAISFLVLGALMVGTSYLYHRAEEWLAASSGEKKE